jgi:hypothetical protein
MPSLQRLIWASAFERSASDSIESGASLQDAARMAILHANEIVAVYNTANCCIEPKFSQKGPST